MINISKLPQNVLNDLHERGLTNKQIEQSSPRELMDEFLNWNGIIGFTGMIMDALDGIRKAETK